MQQRQSEFCGAVDFSSAVLSPMKKGNMGQNMVEIHRSDRSRFVVSLCEDGARPFPLRYPLDSVQENSDGARRGLAVKLTDDRVVAAFRSLDELVVKTAVERSKEWFNKKEMTEDQVRFIYKGVVFKPKEEEEFHCLKFKVKCAGQYPTKLHSLENDATVLRKGAARLSDLNPPSEVAPTLTILSLWFMSGGSFGVSLQAEEIVVKKIAAAPSVGVRLSSSVRIVEEGEGSAARDDDDDDLGAPKRPRSGAGTDEVADATRDASSSVVLEGW